ncbi:RNA-binding protein Musashi-like Rbp6 [Papilio xuthus]|uniref:RNA-binding protein Musashi-like Rbp6 n=1 Tax=Papilio xuthus TaxID=66420 RepID=A0A194Q9U0_PAPXU|nr:RNA-binding protein Musashi-like Rbp6 [Papilio xuthus]
METQSQDVAHSPAEVPNDPGKMFVGGLSWQTSPGTHFVLRPRRAGSASGALAHSAVGVDLRPLRFLLRDFLAKLYTGDMIRYSFLLEDYSSSLSISHSVTGEFRR